MIKVKCWWCKCLVSKTPTLAKYFDPYKPKYMCKPCQDRIAEKQITRDEYYLRLAKGWMNNILENVKSMRYHQQAGIDIYSKSEVPDADKELKAITRVLKLCDAMIKAGEEYIQNES